MKIKSIWEKIQPGTCRLKVIGGWIVESEGANDSNIIFILDKKHQWELDNE